MINSCETAFSHVFTSFHTPNSPSSYIKLHQLTDIVHNCTMRALHSSSSSKTPLGVEAHSAAGEMELQQLGRSPGALDAPGCSGPSWPSWPSRDDWTCWTCWTCWTYSNIFKHIQTTLNSNISKLTLDIIGHHWTSLDIIGHHWTSLDIIGHHWTSLDIIGHHWTWIQDLMQLMQLVFGSEKWTCWGYLNSMPGSAWKKFMRTGWLQQVLNHVQKSENLHKSIKSVCDLLCLIPNPVKSGHVILMRRLQIVQLSQLYCWPPSPSKTQNQKQIEILKKFWIFGENVQLRVFRAMDSALPQINFLGCQGCCAGLADKLDHLPPGFPQRRMTLCPTAFGKSWPILHLFLQETSTIPEKDGPSNQLQQHADLDSNLFRNISRLHILCSTTLTAQNHPKPTSHLTKKLLNKNQRLFRLMNSMNIFHHGGPEWLQQIWKVGMRKNGWHMATYGDIAEICWDMLMSHGETRIFRFSTSFTVPLFSLLLSSLYNSHHFTAFLCGWGPNASLSQRHTTCRQQVINPWSTDPQPQPRKQ